MTYFLVWKEKLKAIYQRYEAIGIPIFKFLMACSGIFFINGIIGYNARLRSFPVIMIFCLCSTFATVPVIVLSLFLFAILHIYFMSKLLAIVMLVILMILYFLLLRFIPSQILVLWALPILFIMKIPYMLPILLGLISTPVSVISVSCATIFFFFLQILRDAIAIPADLKLENTLQLYQSVLERLLHHEQMLMTMAAFSLVIGVTYFVRRRKIDHAFELAIAAGALTNILFFLIADLKSNSSEKIVAMIFQTILAAGIVSLIQCFRFTLDYHRIENVQFEDDDYYYYVKAIPKMQVTAPQVKIKRINPQKKAEHRRGKIKRSKKEKT